MLNKSEPLEAYPSDSFRWNRVEPVGTCWNEIGYSVAVWNPFQTRMKPVLVCSVDTGQAFRGLLPRTLASGRDVHIVQVGQKKKKKSIMVAGVQVNTGL